jgi:hypothetical protein
MENKKKEFGLKPGQKYLSGNIDLGVLGQHKVVFYPNEKKKDTEPDFKSPHGVLWVNKKKEESDLKIKEEII